MDLARNLKHETVSRLNPTSPWQVQPGQTVADAVQLMRDKRVGCVLVCEGRLIGVIFTERDLLRRVLAVGRPFTTRMADSMTPDPLTVQPRDAIGVAGRWIQKGGSRHP